MEIQTHTVAEAKGILCQVFTVASTKCMAWHDKRKVFSSFIDPFPSLSTRIKLSFFPFPFVFLYMRKYTTKMKHGHGQTNQLFTRRIAQPYTLLVQLVVGNE
jgi:hypothetical protein